MKYLTFAVMAGALLLAGCGSPRGSFDDELRRVTVVSALVVSNNRYCGGKRSDEFVDTFVASVRERRGLTETAETQVRAMFVKVDELLLSSKSTQRDKRETCKGQPKTQELVDKLIKGKFGVVPL